MHDVLHSEAFWIIVTSLGTWAVNAFLTRRVASLEPTSPWRRLIRLAHGLLNEIDPKGNDK